MNTHFLRPLVAMLAFVGILATVPAQPAKADTTSTILITAATVAALATVYNVERKHQLAGQVVGYLPNGSAVYADGHVTAPNGTVWYPSNSGQTISCTNNQCYTYGGNGSTPYGYNGYNGYGYNGAPVYNGPAYNPYANRGYVTPVPNNVYNNGYANGYNNAYSQSARRDILERDRNAQLREQNAQLRDRNVQERDRAVQSHDRSASDYHRHDN